MIGSTQLLFRRLTFWSRHSTKVRKELDEDKSESMEKVDDEKDQQVGSKTQIQLAMEAAEFLYEPKNWKA